MAQETEQTFQLVMRAVAEERRPDAAMFLSGCFSLPLVSTRNIVASAPIALLADLDRGQAEAIVSELRPALPADVLLDIVPDGGADVARLRWPRPPRVYGRDVDDFAASEDLHDIKCPVCGGMIRIVKDAAGLKASAVHPGENREPARARSDTIFAPAPVPSGGAADDDPLFAGIRPLATANADYASLRSLQAGDTGFWMDNKGFFSGGMSGRETAPPAPSASPVPPVPPVPGETSHSRRFRSSAGLAAFMKPGVFAVVVARSRDPQVVKMIAEIMGLPEAEARDKCLSLSLPIARGVSLDEAQSLLARLTNLGARARIVRPA